MKISSTKVSKVVNPLIVSYRILLNITIETRKAEAVFREIFIF